MPMTWQEQSKENEYVFATQSGNDNVSRQYQLGWANTATVNQSGDRNDARQIQDSKAAIADINQSGNDNLATQDQLVPGEYNKASCK